MGRISSHEALYACDCSMTIVEWNEGAEALTGVSASEALGEKCWRVIRGRSDSGETICHAGCATGRLLRHGRPARCGALLVATRRGPRRLRISTILVERDGELLALHPLHGGVETAEPSPKPSPLTARQTQVLGMLADGMRPKAIAVELHLAETTVRNHVRAIRRELGTHSQLEAVAAARRRGLVA